MLKTLKTLIRIQDNQLQDLRRRLNKAQDQEKTVTEKIAEFDDMIEKERIMAGQDYLMSQSYSRFSEYALEQRQKLQMLLNDAKAVTQIAHNNLLQSHQEMRKLENIQKRKKAEARQELEQREQKNLDDLVQITGQNNKRLFN